MRLLAVCAILLMFSSAGIGEQLCVSQSSNDDQHLPDGTIVHIAKFYACSTGQYRAIASKIYEKDKNTYRRTDFWPDGEIKNDCYNDVTNQTCIGSQSYPPPGYPFDSNLKPYYSESTTYGDHKQIVSNTKTCRGTPMYEEHFDSNGNRDGTYFYGQDCPLIGTNPVNTSMFTKATYDHGVLNGHYVQRINSGRYTLEGEMNEGSRWGSWKITPQTNPPSTLSVSSGTGVWSVLSNNVPLEEGILVGGRENGRG